MKREDVIRRLNGKLTGYSVMLLSVGLIFSAVGLWDILHDLFWQTLIAEGIALGAIVLELTVYYERTDRG